MTLAALLISIVALLLALLARSTAASQAQAVEDSRGDARRRVENLRAELVGELEKQREMMAILAAGEGLSPEMVREGRLWRDVLPAEAQALLEAGSLRIVDVRTPQETAGGVLPGARLLPVDELQDRLSELPRDGKPTLVYCAMGGRSAAACELLSQHGYVGLLNLQGGIGAWSGPIEPPS
jgi:rhodanese-related sulfurtransferase